MRGHSGGVAADLLVAALQARDDLDGVTVSREPPNEPGDLVSADGTGEAIWIGKAGPAGTSQDITDIEVTIPFGKALPVIWDETYTLWGTVYVAGNDTDTTQKVATDRACELLGEVLGAVASDPSLGFTAAVEAEEDFDGDLSTFYVNRLTELARTGSLDAGHAAGFEFGLRCRCRLHLS